MFRDATADLREIGTCRDCYRYSHHEKREKYWFCKPCRPFHDLVYAKQKGFPYWPAKIMSPENDEGLVEVRFFGGYHQRAMVERQYVKPITVNIHTLQVKRTSLWNKACEELRKHQELLSRVKQNEEFLKEPYGDPWGVDDALLHLDGETSEEESDTDEEKEPGMAENNSSASAAASLPRKSSAKQETSGAPSRATGKRGRGRRKKVTSSTLSFALTIFSHLFLSFRTTQRTWFPRPARTLASSTRAVRPRS